jgi:hypothetical protein
MLYSAHSFNPFPHAHAHSRIPTLSVPPASLPGAPCACAGFLLARRLARLWVAVGLGGSVALSSSGFVLQTCGFKEGSAGGRAQQQGRAVQGQAGPGSRAAQTLAVKAQPNAVAEQGRLALFRQERRAPPL